MKDTQEALPFETFLKATKEAQPYDSLLKMLFGDKASEIIPNLLPGAELLGDPRDEELNIEIDRSTLRADLVFRILYLRILGILNLELETGPDSGMAHRLHQYHAELHAKFELPVLSAVLYPFKCAVPQPPYQEKFGDKVVLTFDYVVICLWELDGDPIVKNHIMSLYVFLPAMKDPKPDLLKQAIREIRQHYSPRQSVEHLAWFHCMLMRTTTMSDQDKHIVEEELNMSTQYKDFLRENPVVHQFIIESETRGEIKGEIKGLRKSILKFLKTRFSGSLVELAEQALSDIEDVKILETLEEVAFTSDEQSLRASLMQHLPQQ